MQIFVTAKTSARQTVVKKKDESHFDVSVKEAPLENRANKAITRALADYFDIAPSRISLVRGEKSKQKVFEIM